MPQTIANHWRFIHWMPTPNYVAATAIRGSLDFTNTTNVDAAWLAEKSLSV
jgi:hypothetical protein